MNIADTIEPKSDQLNADDLISGPRTITITRVKVEAGEQPVSVYYDGDNGKPYKPGKSMRRVFVRLYGNDSANYIGKRITLYRDDSIAFGGVAVGGIRISHASGIEDTVTIALTATRGKRKPYTVKPLVEEDHTPALEAMRLAAMDGTEALRAAWAKLTPAQKAFVTPHNAELKRVAESTTTTTTN